VLLHDSSSSSCSHKSYAGNSHQGQCGVLIRRSVPGVLPTVVESLRDVDVCQISASGNHSMALTAQGRILGKSCHGILHFLRLCVSQVFYLILSSRSSFYLPINDLDDGHILAVWGSQIDGQCGIGIFPTSRTAYRTATDEESISSSKRSHLASTSAIQCKPRLVSDVDFVAIAAGREWNKLQQSSESLSSTQSTISTASLLSSIPRITAIQAGPTYSTALDSLGQLYVWGSNDAEQLGVPIPIQDTLPYINEDNNALRVVIDPDTIQTTNPLIYSRPMHVQTFDSRHNVLLPMRVDVISDTRVVHVACGPNHMWCMGHTRSAADMEHLLKGREYSKTLYEVQVEQQKLSLALPPASSEEGLAANDRIYPSTPKSYLPSPDIITSSDTRNSTSKTAMATTGLLLDSAGDTNFKASSVEDRTETNDNSCESSSALGCDMTLQQVSEGFAELGDSFSPQTKQNNDASIPLQASLTASDAEDETETEVTENYNHESEEILQSQASTSFVTANSKAHVEMKHNESTSLSFRTPKEMPILLDIESRSPTTSTYSADQHGNNGEAKHRTDTFIKRLSRKFLKRRKPSSMMSGVTDDDVSVSVVSPNNLKSNLSEDSGIPGNDQMGGVNRAVKDSMLKTTRKAKTSEGFFRHRRRKDGNLP
jgi:Regulator of chromosome condensation (RCC1) repeat